MKQTSSAELFRKLPSVDEVVRDPAMHFLLSSGQESVTKAARMVLARLRQEITAGLLDEAGLELALTGMAGAVEKQVRLSLDYSLWPLINATGVILHTNFGRAPLSDAAIEHIRETAASYSNLEFELVILYLK